jgi:hypothetical protein
MKFKDIFLVFVILLMFVAVFMFNTLSVGIDNIKKNWNLYRCNPSVMPFAGYFGHSPATNFTYCIQNIQTSYMSHLLEPIHYIINSIQTMIHTVMDDINWIRKKIENMVSNIFNIVSSIFGVFINIIIQFQRIMIKIKDTFMKLIGIVMTLVYVMDGGIKTGESTMAGPIGSALKFVCFHPETTVELKNGEKKQIQNIDVSDVLKGNSKVLAVLKLKGNDEDDIDNKYYRIYSSELDEYIYVTGQHYIYDNKQHKFIHVMDSDFSSLCEDITTPYLSCLVTSDHRIRIGEHEFWDWED